MALTRLIYQQVLPLSLSQAWDFFSNPQNLAVITPKDLGFTIHPGYARESTYAGQLISYTLRPMFGIAVHWVTEITHVKSPHSFKDIQLVGPFALWHHEHRFTQVESGVLMMDIVDYKLPLGFIGHMVNRFKVKNDVEKIFAYRKAKLEELFAG